MKRVITAFRSSTKEIRLENILRIIENETQWEDYDPVDAINHWLNDKEKRLKEENGQRKYKKKQSKKKVSWSLSDTSEDEETERCLGDL